MGFIKQAGGMIVMVAKLREINLLPWRVSGRSFSLQSAPFSFGTKIIVVQIEYIYLLTRSYLSMVDRIVPHGITECCT